MPYKDKNKGKLLNAALKRKKYGFQPRRPDPAVDPWEFENWCKNAERSRKTESYDRGSSSSAGI